MKGYTEEYKNGTWVKAEPIKASWENNPIYKLKRGIKVSKEKVRAAMYKRKQIYFDETGFGRTEDTAVLKTNPKYCILAGYGYGEELWKECFSYLNYHEPFKIVIPSHIMGMSVSFIGGLFAEMIEDIGVDKILERMTIIHPDEDFIKQVVDDIKMYK
jgi:hypothetical protein